MALFFRSGQRRCCVLLTSCCCSWTARGEVSRSHATCWPTPHKPGGHRLVSDGSNPVPQAGTVAGPPRGKTFPCGWSPEGEGPPASRADQWPELSLSPCRTHSQGRSQHSTRESRPETPRGLNVSLSLELKPSDFLICVSFEELQVNLSSLWKSEIWVSISVLSPSGWRDGRYWSLRTHKRKPELEERAPTCWPEKRGCQG